MGRRIIGNLTTLLKQEHINKGYALTEDEFFVYLWTPDTEQEKKATVFYTGSVTEQTIETAIKLLEAKNDP